jgi:hydroxymethylbilane synthase
MAQARWVAERVQAAAAADGTEVDVELVEVTTHGDVTTQSLSSLGGIGVFTSALRDAVLAGEVDFAVHSLKDLPTAPASGLVLVAVPAREDPRDVLVARDGLGLDQLPAGARVGTGSPRRAAQLRAHRPDLAVVDVRGNVDTRMRLVSEGGMDAVVLARAGLLRLGRQDEATQVFDPETLMPAPGQAALAVECRDSWACAGLRPLLGGIDDLPTRLAVTAGGPAGRPGGRVLGPHPVRSRSWWARSRQSTVTWSSPCARWSPRRTVRTCGAERQRLPLPERCTATGR